jgi:DNA-binding response OmpR family regulator
MQQIHVETVREGDVEVLVVDAGDNAEEALRLCFAVRSESAVPIIVLSSRDDPEERIRGFKAGADDYLVKPFNPRELTARIKVVARRAAFAPGRHAEPKPCAYRFGEWRLDVLSHTLQHSDGSAQILTASEFRLLEALVTHAQRVLPRAYLLRILHGPEWNRYEHSIEARMSRLRKLLRSERTLIRGIHRLGYVFESRVRTDYLLAPGSAASCELR